MLCYSSISSIICDILLLIIFLLVLVLLLVDIGGGDGVRASFVLLLIGGLFVLPLVKRTFGEHVTARKFPHMIKEISLKAALYNMFNRMS